MSDMSDRLRDSDGFCTFTAGDGQRSIAADTQLLREAANYVDELEAICGWLLKKYGIAGEEAIPEEWDEMYQDIAADLTTKKAAHLVSCAVHPDD